MKTTFVTLSISLLLGIGLATAAFAGPGSPGKGPGATSPERMEAKLQQMEVMLDLTPEQTEQIREVMANAQTEGTALREVQRDNKEKMRELRDAETFDEGAARELARQQADNRVSMMAHQHATRQQIDTILTPEQRDKHEQMRELRKQQRGQQRGQHKAGRRGGN